MRLRVFLFIIIVSVVGCTTTNYYAEVDSVVPITFDKSDSAKISNYQTEGTFEYYLWGLLPRKQSLNLSKTIVMAQNSGRGDLQIEEFQSWQDLLYTTLSFGMYVPITYKISYLGEKQ